MPPKASFTIKARHLAFSLLIDLVGMSSYTIPGFGEWTDVAYAPLSAWLIYRIYGSRNPRAKLGAWVGFAEEILPFTDIVPTATLMWFDTYMRKKPNRQT